jgi:hypothetical protein
MRTLTAAVVATSLLVSNAFAAPLAVAPLPAGKPAGAKDAAIFGPNGFIILVGLGITAAGLAMVLSNSGNNGVTSPTTSQTSTAGLP